MNTTKIFFLLAFTVFFSFLYIQKITANNPMKNIYQFKFKQNNGSEFDFAKLKGKNILIVNTASECGYTPQYTQLEELYKMYKDKGLEIIAFPCNQFGGQEPGADAEIATFCQKNYGVSFPIMAKTDVKGANKNEVYKWLTSKSENGKFESEVSWNFQKYFINKEGQLQEMFPSGTSPLDEKIISLIK
jgi:glutathione peroxidase